MGSIILYTWMLMELDNKKDTVMARLVPKLESVHERLDRLQEGKSDAIAKKKLHHVLHAGYRTKKTINAARKDLVNRTGVAPETKLGEIPELLTSKGKNLKQLQRLDRLVKPDPRVYIYRGEPVSFDDIKGLERSPIEAEIQEKIKAVNLDGNPQALIDDLSKYGFSIINTNDAEKEKISGSFAAAKTYLQGSSLESKKRLSLNDPSIDAEYRAPKKEEQKGSGYRSIENIVAQRPYVFDEQYKENWQDAGAADLRLVFQELSNLLEIKSQDVLKHIEASFQLPTGSFTDSGHETDQSTLRLIHCISEEEQTGNTSKYFNAETRSKSFSAEEPADSCVGIHTDWGLITLLPTATNQGLEFWYDDTENNGRDSGWVKLDSKEGELIVMPGNIAEIISGGKLKSIPHRVISEGGRLSYAYFTELGKKTNIDQLKQNFRDKGLTEDRVSLFEEEVRPYLTDPEQPLTGENYLLYMKHRNTYDPKQGLIDYAREQGLFLTN